MSQNLVASIANMIVRPSQLSQQALIFGDIIGISICYEVRAFREPPLKMGARHHDTPK